MASGLDLQNVFFWWNLDGNVKEPFICHHYLEGKCLDIKICPFLHSTKTYQWQFGDGKNWYNFNSYYSVTLEKSYRNVNCIHLILEKLDPNKVPDNMQELFQLLGRGDIYADFDRMLLICEYLNKSYFLRQLTTPSSATCRSPYSTKFTWYVKDMYGNWWPHHDPKELSQLLEKQYLINPVGKAIYDATVTRYEIDFIKMMQTNLGTGFAAQLRRRTDSSTSSPVRMNSELPNLSPPKHWGTLEEKEGYALVNISVNTEEFREIWQFIYPSLSPLKIEYICRIQNNRLWNDFLLKQYELKHFYGKKDLNIKKLFYAAKNINEAKEILNNNIDIAKHCQNREKSFGLGAYFYLSAKDAIRNCAQHESRLILVDVIIEKLANGRDVMAQTPDINKPAILFDTITDSTTNPTYFVKYNKDEYYPSHLVAFQLSDKQFINI